MSSEVQPNLKWYTEISSSKKLPPRCPFASVHRCPRYYAAVFLLGDCGVATGIEPDENEKLAERWKRSDVWPVDPEHDTSVTGRNVFSNFCPEVLYERFGWFASLLAYHADETDVDVACRGLSEEGAAPDDWRWRFARITPMHYSDCPLSSLLLLSVNETRS
jgi:hypothetical protein